MLGGKRGGGLDDTRHLTLSWCVLTGGGRGASFFEGMDGCVVWRKVSLVKRRVALMVVFFQSFLAFIFCQSRRGCGALWVALLSSTTVGRACVCSSGGYWGGEGLRSFYRRGILVSAESTTSEETVVDSYTIQTLYIIKFQELSDEARQCRHKKSQNHDILELGAEVADFWAAPPYRRCLVDGRG